MTNEFSLNIVAFQEIIVHLTVPRYVDLYLVGVKCNRAVTKGQYHRCISLLSLSLPVVIAIYIVNLELTPIWNWVKYPSSPPFISVILFYVIVISYIASMSDP